MKKTLFVLAMIFITFTACALAQPTAPAQVPAAPPPAPTAPAATTPQSPADTAAAFNLPYVALLNVQPANTIMNYPATLKWDVKNTTDVVIEPNIGIVQATGSKDFTTPFMTTTYKLTATNAQGSIMATTTLTISGDLPGRDTPAIRQFTAAPYVIKKGGSATLSWKTQAASAVTLGDRTVDANGSTQVTPAETTTYMLTATSTDGTQYQSVTVNVK